MKNNNSDAKKEEVVEEVLSSDETEKTVEADKAETVETEVVSQEEILGNRVKELETELASCKDRMLRNQAELENYKKRLLREKEDAVLYSNTKLIEDLLQFLDNMERAIAASKNGENFKALCDGVQMTQSQLLSTLDKNWGLKKIECAGMEFDPSKHEACMAVVDPELKSETVLEEFQAGYTLHDRVIRPAKVKIGKPE